MENLLEGLEAVVVEAVAVVEDVVAEVEECLLLEQECAVVVAGWILEVIVVVVEWVWGGKGWVDQQYQHKIL